MNATERAQNVYAGVDPRAVAALLPRDAEYRAFALATSGLQEAARSGSFPKLAEAMHRNAQLWIALAAAAVTEADHMPPGTRGLVLDLSQFVQRHSGKVIRGKATVDALIEINVSIMRGLRGRPVAAVAS